jgi:hypothetical protein
MSTSCDAQVEPAGTREAHASRQGGSPVPPAPNRGIICEVNACAAIVTLPAKAAKD